MKYTVLWKPAAEQRLATLWNNAENRNSISDAANTIDRLLQRDAAEIGESRQENIRILLIPPLGVLFRVEELDRLVNVLAVWVFHKREQN